MPHPPTSLPRPQGLSLEAPPGRSPTGRQQGVPAPAPAGVDRRHLAAHLCRPRLQPSLSQNGSLPVAPATSAADSGAAVREFLFTAACKGKNRSGGGLASRELEQGPWLSSTPGFWTPLSGHTGQPAPPLVFPAPPTKPGGPLLSEARWGTGDKNWSATTAVAPSPTQPRNGPAPFCHPSGSWSSQRLEGPPYPVRGFVSNFSFL